VAPADFLATGLNEFGISDRADGKMTFEKLMGDIAGERDDRWRSVMTLKSGTCPLRALPICHE
jgi:hypothetical protein